MIPPLGHPTRVPPRVPWVSASAGVGAGDFPAGTCWPESSTGNVPPMNHGHVRTRGAVVLALLMALSGCKLLDKLRGRNQDAGQTATAVGGDAAAVGGQIALPNPNVAPLGQIPDASAAIAAAQAAVAAAQAAAADAGAQAATAIQALQAATDAGAQAAAAAQAGTEPAAVAPTPAVPGTAPAPGTAPGGTAPGGTAQGETPTTAGTPTAAGTPTPTDDEHQAHRHHGGAFRNYCKDHPGSVNPATGSTCPMIGAP